MALTSEQFITQMKLRELRRQRETLLATYNQLDQVLASSPNSATQLQLLYNGLREIFFAGHALHPDVTNLEPLLNQAFAQQFSTTNAENSPAPTLRTSNNWNSIDFWRQELEKELGSGRLRSEIVFIFAALLEEWTKNNKVEGSEERSKKRAELLAQVTEISAQSPLNLEFLDQLFAQLGFGTAKTSERLQKIIQQQLPNAINYEELREVLRKISRDRYHSAETRRQAQNLLRDTLMLKEFSDALTLILNELDQWDWPTEGVPVHASLTPNKWRLFLDEDLPTAALLEILGRRWQKIFEEFFKQHFDLQLQEYKKSAATLPPTERVEGALRLYQQAFGIKPNAFSEVDIWTPPASLKESDLWEDPESLDPKYKQKLSLEQLLKLWTNEPSIISLRAELKARYRDLGRLDGYAANQNQRHSQNFTEIEQALAQINAEIRLGQSAFPGRPIYILKADLKDYYPSLSHELIIEVLARFGLTNTQLEFFRRYLAVQFNDSKKVRMLRGTPNHRRLSDLIGELVMLLLDYHIKQTARVQAIRLIDDLCLIAGDEQEALKAWQALQKFCSAFGLSLNEEKSGAVCVGGELPSGLPTKAPVWSMVTINQAGEWRVDETRYNQFLAQARQQVRGTPTVIAKVEEYNNSLNYLVKSLALRIKLDDSHRQSVSQALTTFSNDFFEPGRGMVEELRALIKERFLGQDSLGELPDGWLHWPITAGGLSLYHPLILTNSYARNYYTLKVESSQAENKSSQGLSQKISDLKERLEQLKVNNLAPFLQKLMPKTAPIALPDERSSDWQRRWNSWHSLYQHFLEMVNPAPPVSNRVMETLVEDFIERGSEISMGGQDNLSAYWRWIVYLYGPQIRDQLGTFRFLITELVPAQLITGRYRQGFFEHATTNGENDFGTATA